GLDVPAAVGGLGPALPAAPRPPDRARLRAPPRARRARDPAPPRLSGLAQAHQPAGRERGPSPSGAAGSKRETEETERGPVSRGDRSSKDSIRSQAPSCGASGRTSPDP